MKECKGFFTVLNGGMVVIPDLADVGKEHEETESILKYATPVNPQTAYAADTKYQRWQARFIQKPQQHRLIIDAVNIRAANRSEQIHAVVHTGKMQAAQARTARAGIRFGDFGSNRASISSVHTTKLELAEQPGFC